MKQETTKKAAWENELQALKNLVGNLGLKGFEVFVNHNGFRKKQTYFLRDETGNTITGSWAYPYLNHYIMGYGKAIQKAKILEAEVTRLRSLINEFADKIKAV